MLDLKAIRKNPEGIKKSLAKRLYEVNFDRLFIWDDKRKEIILDVESLKAKKNKVSKEIPELAREGKDISSLKIEMKDIGLKISELDGELKVLQGKIDEFLSCLPNIPDDDVVAGDKENNETLHHWGEKPEFTYEFKNHVDLATGLELIDYERGAKLGGNGYWIYRGKGAQLEWAILNYCIEEHIKDGYEFLLPPHILVNQCGYTAGQFPKFDEDVYYVGDTKEDPTHFLIPTSETALVNVHRDEILPGEMLPKKYFAYSPCYRKEAGSHRAEERGMIRGHQFNKVEMFQFTKPEQSKDALKELILKAEKLVQGLGLHYRLTKLAAGDVSATMATTYDIEVWLPSMGIYKEVSSASCSNDYQARRGNIRYRETSGEKPQFLHTLNASGLATSRIIPAILEQNQREDGSVVVPEVLRKYLNTDILK